MVGGRSDELSVATTCCRRSCCDGNRDGDDGGDDDGGKGNNDEGDGGGSGGVSRVAEVGRSSSPDSPGHPLSESFFAPPV